eukprot:gene27546-17285_t
MLYGALSPRQLCRNNSAPGSSIGGTQANQRPAMRSLQRTACSHYDDRKEGCECRTVGVPGIAPHNISVDW